MMKNSSLFYSLSLTLFLCGCNDTRNFAPERADLPWHPSPSTGLKIPEGIKGFVSPGEKNTVSEIRSVQKRLAVGDDIKAQPLGLADMIDIAERHNPDTRFAWESARQAAINIGMSRAAFMPQLTLSAMGGYQRMALPLPNYLSKRGYLTSNGAAVFPKLELDYLLLDFGHSRSLVQEAQQKALAANFGFTAVHQALILAVIRAYYAHEAARNILKASHAAADHATVLLRSADARHAHGEATVVDVAIARRNLAQANYDCDKAEDTEHATWHALLAVLGLPATTELTLQPVTEHRLPQIPEQQLQRLINQALQARPDIMADVARIRAEDAALRGARATMKPRISLASNVSAYLGELKTYGGASAAPASAIAQPQGQAFLQLSWPVYQGGMRANTVRLAESRRAQAEAMLAKDQIRMEREVADALDELKTALAQVHSAQTLRDAAQVAYNSASQAYAHGVGTFTDASAAVAALYQAQAAFAVSTTDAFTKAANLAHATGELVSGSEISGITEKVN